MSNLSQFTINPFVQALAGGPIAVKSMVELGPDGFAYQAQCSDYMATTVGGTVISALSAFSTYVYTQANGRIFKSSCVGLDGSIYVLTSDAASTTGLVVNKFSSLGASLGTLVITSTGNDIDPQIVVLANGNLAVIYGGYYAVISPSLFIITAPTNYASPNNGVLNAISTGGFCIAFQQSASVTLLTYNSLGVQQSTTTVTTTSGSSSSYVHCNILSNGNICVSYYGTTYFTFAIYNTAGVQQVAPTATTITANVNYCPIITVVPGFFAIGVYNTTTSYSLAVYSNAGAQQGSNFTNTALSVTGGAPCAISDGANFWFAYATVAPPYNIVYTKITTAGVATAATGGYIFSGSGNNFSAVAYDGIGNIIAVSIGGTYPQYSAYNINTNTMIVSPTNINTSITATTAYTQQMLPLGDGAILIYGTEASTVGYQLVMKPTASYPLGACLNTAALIAGNTATIDATPGPKQINPLRGTVYKGFSSLMNAGIVASNMAILRGAGIARNID